MNDLENYTVGNALFPPDLLLVAEFLTIVSCLWLIYEGVKLFRFFWGHENPLAKILSIEAFTKTLLGAVTLLMGLFLFFDFASGVKFIVLVRPIFVCLSAYTLHRLYRYYKYEI